ncbi:MAG: alkaline phosphatase, DedA family [Bryobacterales bacterium]|jgi:membrane protein DedA with SNARE-associated domain|nr:alkaline phosphatase, DedA family [Bryobacterales bacterium]
MDGVFAWVATHGYWALYLLLALGVVGLPIPDETILVFAGYLIGRGTLHPVAAFAAALAGAWSGISLSYVLGRTLGAGAVHRYGKYIHFTEDRLATVHRWFDRIGHWMLVIGYYIAGVRHLTAVVAGMSKLEFPTFMAYAWTGGALWVTTFLTLGYFLGENWRQVAELVHTYVAYASVAIIAIAIVWYFLWKRSAKARPSQPG